MANSSNSPFDEGCIPIDGLRTLSTAAHCSSFSEAAVRLGITHGSVSRRISALENWLGVVLFDRHGRGVRLTPDGQRFASRVDEALSLIDEAAFRWRRRRGPEVVKLSVGPAFAKLWLFDRLPSLERVDGGDTPEIRVELSIEPRNADVETGQADIAVRYGRGRWRNSQAQLLIAERLYPVASPGFAQRVGLNGDPRSYLSEMLLHDSDPSGWRAWFGYCGVSLGTRPRDMRFEDYTLVLAAAEAGLGIALARMPLAANALGGLVRIAEFEAPSPLNYYMVLRQHESRPAVNVLARRLLQLAGSKDAIA